jgi:hypothetical protein
LLALLELRLQIDIVLGVELGELIHFSLVLAQLTLNGFYPLFLYIFIPKLADFLLVIGHSLAEGLDQPP